MSRWLLWVLVALGAALFFYVGFAQTFHRLTQGSWSRSLPWVRAWMLGGVLLLAGSVVTIVRPKKGMAAVALALLLVGMWLSFQGLFT
jgi:hypothetical protein